MNDAACSGRTGTFFSDHPDDQRDAEAVCLACPVKAACRDWRDRVRPKHGTWAGRTYRQTSRRH